MIQPQPPVIKLNWKCAYTVQYLQYYLTTLLIAKVVINNITPHTLLLVLWCAFWPYTATDIIRYTFICSSFPTFDVFSRTGLHSTVPFTSTYWNH